MKAWLSLILVAACGHSGGDSPKQKSPEDVKKEWSPKVSARLEKIVAAAKAADGADLGAAAPADGLDFQYGSSNHPNVIAVQSDDVQSATAPRPKAATADDQAAAMAKAAEEGKEVTIPMGPPPPRFAFQSDNDNHVFAGKQLLGIETGNNGEEWKYDQLVNAKYVLVVTPSAVTWPNKSGSTFEPGTAHLRAVLVEVDTAKPLGGFETDAHSSQSVSVELSRTDLADRKLQNDFLSETAKAVKKGIAERWPTAKTPVLDWGL